MAANFETSRSQALARSRNRDLGTEPRPGEPDRRDAGVRAQERWQHHDLGARADGDGGRPGLPGSCAAPAQRRYADATVATDLPRLFGRLGIHRTASRGIAIDPRAQLAALAQGITQGEGRA